MTAVSRAHALLPTQLQSYYEEFLIFLPENI